MNSIVEKFFNELDAFRKVGILEAINYESFNEILISHHSTALEGSSLTEDETRLLLTEGITAKGKPLRDHNMVQDHHRALLYIIEQAKKKRQITVEFIQELSTRVMQTSGGIINASAGSYDSSKGDFRKSMVYVGSRYFPDYQKVPESVLKLCQKINAQIDKLTTTKQIFDLAFDAHFDLVSIHPFADGNGRVSRLLMNYILAYHHQLLSIVFKEDKAEYFEALEKTRNEDNMRPIRDFMYKQQIKYLNQETNKLKRSQINIMREKNIYECFAELITCRTWYKQSGIDRKRAALDKKYFLNNKLSEDKIRFYLKNAGYLLYQNEMWIKNNS